MQVLFRGPEAREWQRDLYGPLSQWLGLEGERYAIACYRLTYEEEAHGHPRPVYQDRS